MPLVSADNRENNGSLMDSSLCPEIPIDMRVRYLQKRAQDVALCETALQQADFESIQSLAHRMKGNGTTFGFPEISRFGDELEQAALRRDRPATTDMLSKLSTWIAGHA